MTDSSTSASIWPVDVIRAVEARVQPAGRQPVAQLVVVGRDRENHAHVEGLALGAVALDHRRQRLGADRVNGLAVLVRDVGLHLRPDLVRHRDPVAVQVHRERRDDMRLGAVADGSRERLAGQHVGAVEPAVDHAVEQNLPVRLRLERDEEALVLEIPQLIGHRERRHVGQLDEAEGELVLFHVQHLGVGRRRQRDQGQSGRGSQYGAHGLSFLGDGTSLKASGNEKSRRPGLRTRSRIERLCSVPRSSERISSGPPLGRVRVMPLLRRKINR